MVSVKTFLRFASICLVWFFGALHVLPAQAVVSVSVLPANANVPLGGSASVALTWTLTPYDGTEARSSSGSFLTGPAGSVLGTVSRRLAKTVAAVGDTTTVTEVILVPTDVIYRAHKLGLTSLVFLREFEDDGVLPGASAYVTLNITSPAASGFSLSRLSLLFDNGAPVRVLGMKESLHAQAEINFSSSGLIQGIWEVAGPSSTAGQPVYRPLTAVRQYLAGNDKQILRSPGLPTDASGFYLVRLRITDPVPGFDQPVLRYFVSSGKPGEVLPVMPIGLVTPAPQTLLAPDTLFAWEPIRGARAYQLEVYARTATASDTLPDLGGESATAPPTLPGTPAVTGMLVPGGQTKTVLSSVSRSHLQPGRRYLWRVLAIGGDGSIVGESPVREIRLP